MSEDGKFLYAAGLPGVNADGTGNPRMSASITVFDTKDGSVRLLAGLLGGEMLSFGSPILDLRFLPTARPRTRGRRLAPATRWAGR